MNSKKAKQLRKAITMIAALKGKVHAATEYTANEQASVLSPTCPKGLYRRTKRAIASAYTRANFGGPRLFGQVDAPSARSKIRAAALEALNVGGKVDAVHTTIPT